MISNTRTEIDLLRHGECEGGHIFRGATDVALSEKGLTKMRTVLAKAEGPWDLIISSPLKRCLVFAEALAGKRALDLIVDNNLREMHFGDWEGRDIAGLWRDQQERMSAWCNEPEENTPPNGEALKDMCERVSLSYNKIVSQHQGKKILVLTHGGVIRVLLANILAMPLSKIGTIDVPYASLSRIQHTAMPSYTSTRLLGHNMIPTDEA